MSYSAQSDIENRFGRDNIRKWSNLSGGTAADLTRIAAAIAWADAYIDGRFRGGRHTVPLTDTTEPVLVNWSRSLAGWWLYTSRGLRDDNDEADKLQADRDEIDKEINAYLSGQRRFSTSMGIEPSASPTGPTLVK